MFVFHRPDPTLPSAILQLGFSLAWLFFLAKVVFQTVYETMKLLVRAFAPSVQRAIRSPAHAKKGLLTTSRYVKAKP